MTDEKMTITHAQLAARLLRDAAAFFRHLGEENPALAESMKENAAVYEEVAQMVDTDPNELVELEPQQ